MGIPSSQGSSSSVGGIMIPRASSSAGVISAMGLTSCWISRAPLHVVPDSHLHGHPQPSYPTTWPIERPAVGTSTPYSESPEPTSMLQSESVLISIHCTEVADHDIMPDTSRIICPSSIECARSSAGQSAWLRTRRSGVRSPPGVLQYQGLTHRREAFFCA